jgi:hypothetical protein
VRTFHVVPVGGDHCDFCTSQPVVQFYPCRNFDWQKQPIFASESTGKVRAWAACEKCAALIDAEQWDSLTERALRHFRRKHEIPRSAIPGIRGQLCEIHLLFRDHKI